MRQDLLVQHLEKNMLGRLRLKLLSAIPSKKPILSNEEIALFVRNAFKSSQIAGDLYAAILLLTLFSWESYSSLVDSINVEELLIALEKFPPKHDFFMELENCPSPLPESIGILIKCSKLTKVEDGFVYSVYILEEEIFPESLIDYIEVRACQGLPDPLICSNAIEGRRTSDLNEINQSLIIQIALKSLYFLLQKNIQAEKDEKKKEIEKTTRLLSISDNLSARLQRQKSGKVELAVIIGDKASVDELRSAWTKIDALRTQLKEHQGTDLNQIKYSLLYDYYQKRKYGWSRSLIAMDINYDCLVNLCSASDEIIDINSRYISSRGLTNAYYLLKSVRMKNEDVWDYLMDGLKDIRNGKCPWPLKEGPVNENRVREAVRQWEREQSSQKVIIKKPPKTYKVPTKSLESPAQKRYRQMAKDLLNQNYPGSYDEYDAAFLQTITKTGYMGYVHVHS